MKILFVIPYNFVPPDSGNKNLLYNLLKYVTRVAACDLVLLVDDPAEEIIIEALLRREYPSIGKIMIFSKQRGIRLMISRLRFLAKGYHPSLGRYFNESLAAWLTTQTVKEVYDLIHLDMIHTAPYRNFCKEMPTLLVASDAYSNAARLARILSRNKFTKLRLLFEEWLIKNFEKKEYQNLDVVCTVSERDADYLNAVAPKASIRTIGIAVAPEYAERKILHIEASTDKQKKILCVGSLNHDIIADGIIEFVTKSLPIIRRRHPDVSVTVLGRSPVANLKKCIEETPGVKHVDFVQDYADFLDQDWVYVYPQRCGSGLQTKVQQAMALGLPVVGYDVSFGGLSVRSGTNCFICETQDDLTRYVERLVDDDELRKKIGSAAATHVRKRFSIEAMGSQMLNLYNAIG